MLDYSLIIERLKMEVPDFKIVAGAINLEATAVDTLAYPSVTVIPLRLSAAANTLVNVVDQEVTERFSCRVGVRNMSDQYGEAAYGELRRLIESVQRALLGFYVADNYDPIESTGGALVRLADRIVWWDEFFQTRMHLRAET